MLLNCGAGEDSWESWTARRSNQSILKENNLEYSLEGLILKLKLQNFGHLMWRANSLEKTLRLGKIEGRRRRGWQRLRWLDMNLSKLQEIVKGRESWHAVIHGVTKSQKWFSDWTTTLIQNVNPGENVCLKVWNKWTFYTVCSFLSLKLLFKEG